MKVTVLYPQPLNQEKFESDYNAHLKLLHEKTGIPTDLSIPIVVKQETLFMV
jgi:hypothetical protein